MKRDVWLEGRTKRRWLRRGRRVLIVGDPYADTTATVCIDGKRAHVLRVNRLRDGGTTTIETDAGVILRPAPRYKTKPTLDGEELL